MNAPEPKKSKNKKEQGLNSEYKISEITAMNYQLPRIQILLTKIQGQGVKPQFLTFRQVLRRKVTTLFL